MKNLMISNESAIEILRLSSQDDITTQSLQGEEQGVSRIKDEIRRPHIYGLIINFFESSSFNCRAEVK